MMVVAIMVVILAFIIAKNWIEDDPNKKKEIKNGHLVAVKTFTSHGQTIRKGTKGGRVETSVEVNKYDNAWADANSQLLGECVIRGDALIINSTLRNWIVDGARVVDCDCDNPDTYRGAFWGGDHVKETHHKSNL